MRDLIAKLWAGFGGGAKGPAPLMLRQLELPLTSDPLYVIGDLHGCTPLLQAAEQAIAQDMNGATGRLLLLGDVIDRGPQSADMLDHLLRAAPHGLQRDMILGNHEMMFLRFVEDPIRHGSWLDFGGRETLLSYGIDVYDFELLNAKRRAQVLAAHIPQTHLDFLTGRAAICTWGDFLFAHAGLDGALALAEQTEDTLMWRKKPVTEAELPSNITLVHGHIPATAPDLTGRVINLDVGAYMTGKACILRLQRGQDPRLIWVGGAQNSGQ